MSKEITPLTPELQMLTDTINHIIESGPNDIRFIELIKRVIANPSKYGLSPASLTPAPVLSVEKIDWDSMEGIYWYQPLFDLMSNEHNLTLVQSEMDDIIQTVTKMLHPAQQKQQGEEKLYR
jgi:hypothetical protein